MEFSSCHANDLQKYKDTTSGKSYRTGKSSFRGGLHFAMTTFVGHIPLKWAKAPIEKCHDHLIEDVKAGTVKGR